MESGARTVRDFQKLVAEYDRIDANKQRGIEMTELPRGELPWEQEVSSLPVIFPAWMNMPLEKQLQKGNFIDAIPTCSFPLRSRPIGKRRIPWNGTLRVIFLYKRFC